MSNACATLRSLAAYIDDFAGKNVIGVDLALKYQPAAVPQGVIYELLSAPRFPRGARTLFEQLTLLDNLDGYCEREALLRARILVKGTRTERGGLDRAELSQP